MTRQKSLLLLLALYIVIVAAASFFHANNFQNYTDSEGAAGIDYMEFLFFGSVMFQGLMYFMLKQISWKAAIFSTILNLLVSVMLTIVIINWLEFSEGEQQWI